MNIENNRNFFITIAVGFVLVVAAAVLSFLMVQQILKSTLLLNFFTFAISVSGLFLGVIGGSMYVKSHRKNDRTR
jgi:hypothetical protein